ARASDRRAGAVPSGWERESFLATARSWLNQAGLRGSGGPERGCSRVVAESSGQSFTERSAAAPITWPSTGEPGNGDADGRPLADDELPQPWSASAAVATSASEDGAHRRRPPALASVGGRRSVGIEAIRDLPKAQTGRSRPANPIGHVGWHCRRS